ncbi:uncharacterized protein LOC129266185 [Lytechinus pictus]|uniref:uncharacterized protein LOC129266185 n=1 Tax=Lytechinus pictus TaxID=7653 RepID=UPI0030BA13A0
MAEKMKQLIIWPSTNNLPTMFFRVPTIRLKSYYLYIFCTWITSIVTSTTATMETTTNLLMNCTYSIIITSPGYPFQYQNNDFVEWDISAPHGRRILVTFNYFSLELYRDYIDVTDEVFESYTGENMQFPPYLAKGNKLRIAFFSSPRGRRKGFNISLACHEPPRDNVSVRLMGGIKPSEGLIELSSTSGDWMRVCKEYFSEKVAEVVCGELGYPGVKDITFVNVNTQNCTRPPRCGDYTYRLLDCTAGNSSYESDQVVKIICHEPGYRGCYELQTQQLQNSSKFAFSTASLCVYMCKTHGIQTLALINEHGCFCSPSAEVNLNDLFNCFDHSPSSKFSIYDASVGFCDELNDTIVGSWDSNITWFGSIVHLTCMYGYTLKGNGTIQCVPGVTPYYPIWNDSIPECEPVEGSTLTYTTDIDKDYIFTSFDELSTQVFIDPATEIITERHIIRENEDCTYIILPILIGSTVVLFLILLAVTIGWVISQIWKYCSSKPCSDSKITHTYLDLQDRTPADHVNNLPVIPTMSGASAVALIHTTSHGKVGGSRNTIIYETIPTSDEDKIGYFSDSDIDANGYVLPNPPKNLNGDEIFMHENETIGDMSKMLEDENGYLVPNVCK